MSFFGDVSDFFEDIGDRLRGDHRDRRREERALDNSVEENALSHEEAASDKPRVVKVDFKVKENALNHNCEKYELVSRGKGTAIIRRGGVFKLDIELNTDADLKKLHQLRIYFSFGVRPLTTRGTKEILEFTGKKEFDQHQDEWDHRVVSEEGTKASLEVRIPHDIPVGIWRLIFEIQPRRSSSNSNRHSLRAEELLYILFNPWSKHDDVYMAEEDRRQEYVLNDVGKIWVGGYPTARGRSWVFGQFDDAVLPASILLLEKSGLNPEQKGDVIAVSRAISKMINSNDDSGVISGRWDGKYEDGISPSSWTGSIKIAEQYLENSKPVKYGQCWVFSGFTTTVCRSLGIPCRSVTNLNSAHDTNSSLTIDKYYDENGEDLKPYDVQPGSGDSIWNFHVWNDAWMVRHDLPDGYGGWQAIDATPQERSDSIFQCGPASLVAVRNGQTNHNYDVNFVLGEVNADMVTWRRDKTEKTGFRKVFSNKTHVGRQLLTKKVGKTEEDSYFATDKEDVTGDYKPSEGTRAERVTLHAAVRKTRAARHAFSFPSFAEQDVEFELEDVERVPIGQDFAITIKAKNTADALRTVYLVLSAKSEYYTGVKAHAIKRAEGEFKIQPDESQTLSLKVRYNEYYDKLVEYAMIKLTALADVRETTQTWISDDNFQVIKPSLKIEATGIGYVGKPLLVKISFTNPLDKRLRNSVLVIDGPGLTRPKTIPLDDVPASAVMEYEAKIYPKRNGKLSFVASFNSKELIDLTGSSVIKVEAE